MSRAPTLLAFGLADERLVAGTSGVRAEWRALGVEAPGDGRAFKALFRRADASFRRLDRASRALVLAAEAAGLDAVLPADARDDTAIVVETERGSLEADLRFAGSLEPGPAQGAVFVYTLPSASLGEVALRHRLRGPALCLSIGGGASGGTGEGSSGEALREAVRLIEDGEARFALAACVEASSARHGDLAPALRAVVALIAAPDAATSAEAAARAATAAAAAGPWPEGPDPFAELAERARGLRP